ncbi:MAG: hypothetical protein CVV42_00685 [Candidatus Riflebacteria bacterium HGW-Riflebacteria-2]|jgi:outer membrane murein-binding lipoprotein Lpp|nr:MAG: hypothetical protein CVV42_00685 [Candidatus Riflebacteria bacterium HGW-Riflebacteria-2]
MSIKGLFILGFCAIAIVGVFVLTGCCNKGGTEVNPAAGPAEKAGATLDKAVEKTGDEARRLAEKASKEAKETADKAIDKTGEILEKAGNGLAKAGADLQESQPKETNP